MKNFDLWLKICLDSKNFGVLFVKVNYQLNKKKVTYL